MKTRFTFLFIVLLCFMMSSLLMSCQNTDGDGVTPDTGCRIQKYTAIIQQAGSPQIRNQQATFTYDGNGNLIKADSSWTIAGESDGMNKSKSATSATYLYNDAGFLTQASSQTILQTTLSPGNVTTQQKSLQTNFTYHNDKLSGYVTKSISASGLEILVTGTFEYDASGNVVKQTAINTYTYNPASGKEIPQYPSGWQRSWTYSNKQLVDYTEKTASAETHPYTIQNGLVTKASYDEYFTTYEYDSQQRLVKCQAFRGNKLNSYYTQEWSEGKISAATFSSFKGFPDLQPAMGYTGIIKNYNFYADHQNSGVIKLTSITAESQLNGQGFVTNTVSVQKDLTPGITSAAGSLTESYIYTGCN